MLTDIENSSLVCCPSLLTKRVHIESLIGKESVDMASRTELFMNSGVSIAANTAWKAPKATREDAHRNRILTSSNVGRRMNE